MRSLPVQIVVVLAFALIVGDFAFRTWAPPLSPEHRIGGVVTPMTAPIREGETRNSRHIYLRKTWAMTEAPVTAWIKVIGHDAFEIYVNGRRVRRTQRAGIGRQTSAIADITRLVHAGENSIAIHAAQLILDRTPAVAATGLCEFADGSTMTLDDPAAWRAIDYYDRRGTFWYETDFNDDHWQPADIGKPVEWNSQVFQPPSSFSRPRDSRWITSAASGGDACFARTFHLEGKPREGWIRLATTGASRLAINGEIVLGDQSTLAIPPGRSTVEQTLEIGPYLRSGENTVSVAVSDAGEAPRVRADLEATINGGDLAYVATDENWRSAAGDTQDWRSPSFEEEDWNPCAVESGFQGIVPRSAYRRWVDSEPSIGFLTRRSLQHLGFVALIGLLGWVGSKQISQIAERVYGETQKHALPAGLPSLALVLPTALAATGGLMTWDFAWTSLEVYRPLWLMTLLALVPIQWLLMLSLAGPSPKPSSSGTSQRLQRMGMVIAWSALFVGALWVRARDIKTEPIHHDEVTAYMFTMSIFDHGFPGGQVHPEIPFGYCATSELSFFPNALCALFTNDPLLVIRVPSIFWSMATLLLIGYVATRWFSLQTGLVAGFLYAVAPNAISTAYFGRYMAMTQFFTLLTLYFAYEAARGNGPINTRKLWHTTLSFIAMYLTWEGTGIFGVGLALATLFLRRSNLRSVIACPTLYYCTLTVGIVAVVQAAHRIHQQTQRLWYGEGINSLSLKPMWRYPFFDFDFYLLNSSWTKDALLPMAGLAIAAMLAISHRWRHPIRFSIISLLSNTLLMSALLPLTSNRYAYHLTEIVLLLSAASAVAVAEAIVRLAAAAQSPALRFHARAVVTTTLALWAVLASGWSVRTTELRSMVSGSPDARYLRIPDWVGPTRYVHKNLQEGDVIVSLMPHAQNFTFYQLDADGEEIPSVDYWLESRLVIQATLGDERNVPLDRRSGAVMLYDLDQVERLFAEHDRVWYCTMRYAQSRVNESEVSRYLRQHMDVVYEDFATSVMLRDKNHRPAPIRVEEDEAGQMALDHFLK